MVTAEPLTPTTTTAQPMAPHTLEEAGLSSDMVLQLALKTLYFSGQLTGTELADRLKLNFTVVESVLETLVEQRYVAIVDGGVIGRSSFTYRISDSGRERANLFLENNHYVGAAPVPLQQYQDYMTNLESAQTQVATREALRQVVSQKLVVSDKVLDQLGPAINARHSLFLYGPPGNGKSVIAAAMGSLFRGGIEIPHALEIEGSIVRIFDPVHHEPLPIEEENTSSIEVGPRHDDRWIRCKRPIVMVGGELELENLDLVYNSGLGFYRAPVQTKANGGVLVIDDFGRQRCSPQALLNRWIVPLEMRHDYLTLQTGQKITIPFSTFVVFATNLKPTELVDEAFLRRIHYKVFAQSPTIEEFIQIFERVCAERDLPFRREAVEDLLERYYRPRQMPMRGCHPRDLVDHVISLAEYTESKRELTADLLDAACASYFVDEREATGQSSIWNVLPPKS
jgi:predicted ATPase with chaperone activity